MMYIKVNNSQKNVSVSVNETVKGMANWTLVNRIQDVPVAFPETTILPIVLQLKCKRSRQHRSDQI